MKLKQNGFSIIFILGAIFVVLTILIIIYLFKMQPSGGGGVLDLFRKTPPPQTNSQNSQNLTSSDLACRFPDEIDDCYDNLEFETWVDDGLP